MRDSRRCWRHVWLPASFPFQKFESHWSSGRATPSFLAPTCTHSIQTGLRTVFFHRPLGVRVLSTLTSCRRRGRGGLIRHGAMGLWSCRPGCAPPRPAWPPGFPGRCVAGRSGNVVRATSRKLGAASTASDPAQSDRLLSPKRWPQTGPTGGSGTQTPGVCRDVLCSALCWKKTMWMTRRRWTPTLCHPKRRSLVTLLPRLRGLPLPLLRRKTSRGSRTAVSGERLRSL